ncbi:MAG: hypothetical protein M3Q34_01620 [bacterium]|nr:hypothetical protein [bacterium]
MENNSENIEKKYWGKKFYESRLNTALLFVLIILMIVAIRIMSKDKDVYTAPLVGNTIEQNNNIGTSDYIVTDENFEKQWQWANANDGMPLGWVKYDFEMWATPVEVYGPVIGGMSFIARLNGKMISLLAPGDAQCVGDSESGLCVFGNDPEVIHYFNVVTYRY